jgi:IS30 family transposase
LKTGIGVIIRFYPRKMEFTEATAKDVKKIEKMINNRSVGKCGYKTPNEIYILKADAALIA